MNIKEQAKLAIRWQDHQDIEARDALVLHFMNNGAICKLIRKYIKICNLTFEDIQQETYFPIMKALEKWDRNRGGSVFFSVQLYVNNHLRELTLDNKSVIKPLRKDMARKLYYALRKVAPDLLRDEYYNPNRITEASKQLGVQTHIIESFIAWQKGWSFSIEASEGFDLTGSLSPEEELIEKERKEHEERLLYPWGKLEEKEVIQLDLFEDAS